MSECSARIVTFSFRAGIIMVAMYLGGPEAVTADYLHTVSYWAYLVTQLLTTGILSIAAKSSRLTGLPK